MENERLRKIASAFLKKHGHSGYAQTIKTLCAADVIQPLLKCYGRKELLRLYLCMPKDLKQGFLYWFPLGDTTSKQLEKKLLEIDRAYKNIRDDWVRRNCESLPKSEVKNYFRKLRVVILAWLKGK